MLWYFSLNILSCSLNSLGINSAIFSLLQVLQEHSRSVKSSGSSSLQIPTLTHKQGHWDTRRIADLDQNYSFNVSSLYILPSSTQ